MPILANQYCANVGKSILVQHRHQYWVILVTILVQYTDGLRFSYIVPILANQYCANVGKSILVQHYNQYWVNIATNIGAISAWTTVFLYCANIGCLYCANIGLPLLVRLYWHNIGMPILAQYRKTVVHAYIGSILVTILTQYCFQCWTNIAPMLLATWVESWGYPPVKTP